MKKIVIILILIFTTYSAEAQTFRGKNVFSLNDCLGIALRNNFDIQISEAMLISASSNITSAFGDFLPSVNFSTGYNRRLNVDGGKTVSVGGQIIPVPAADPNSFDMSASVNYVVFDGFSRSSNYSQAQDSYNYYDASSKHMIQQVRSNIYKQFIDIIKKAQILKIRREDLELGKNELKKIQAQFEAGIIPIGVVYAQEADLGNREYSLLVADNEVNIAKANLLITMGLEPDMGAEFLESSLPNNITQEEITKFRQKIGSVGASETAALNNRQDYISAQYNMQAAESNITIARSGYFPTLSLGGGWSWSNSEFNQFDELGRSYLGLRLSIPIFENFKTNNRIQSAKLNLKQREVEKLKVEQTVRVAVQTGLINLETAEKQLEITKRSIKSAQQNYESASERFKVGNASITDRITANTQLLTARINRINAVYDYILAQKSILFAMGKL